MNNIYLEKIATLLSKEAGIGEVGKKLIKEKLAPAMSKWTRGAASKVHEMARNYAGSKVSPRVFSTPELARHGAAMANLGKKLGGRDAGSTNRIMAVATRAKRMGVDLEKTKIRRSALGGAKT